MKSKSSAPRRQKRVDGQLWMSLLLGILLLAAWLYVFFDHLFSEAPSDRQRIALTLPSVEGLSLDEATASLPDTYYNVTTVYLHDDEQPAGLVLKQTPCGGMRRKIAVGTEQIAVKLVVSLGPRYETVPNVMAKDGRQAQIDLEKQGFSVNVKRQTAKGIGAKANRVIYQEPPAGCQMTRGSTVMLYVAYPSEDPSVQCPSLIGLDRMSALATLRAAGLTVGEITVVSVEGDPDTSPEGLLSAFWTEDTVVSQGRPVGCWLPKGAAVDLVLKKKSSFYIEPIQPQWQKGMIRPWNTAPTPPNFTEESSNA